ncbi:hypothetical protein AYL99_08043 [Fonsecaea erecta]|uniref:Transcription factor domain-containing protein n=1 Tax=Fonsecaea erecta TaxID=1367422 RepID=A0A178ZE12_9EURO|nr:hypothetical protein AYL99_08043 [Fonsecaea erecta]OAP57305.1 hypothetical protein AYL99_08043 [Fonsecaea erecta]
MGSNKPSKVLWLDAKTPTNFKPTADFDQKSIIAIRAQQYSTNKRVEEAFSLLSDLANDSPQSPHERTASSPGHGVRKVPPKSRPSEDTLEQDDAQKFAERKVSKRRPRPQFRVRPTRATRSSFVGKGASLSLLLQGGNSDPFSATPIYLSALAGHAVSIIEPLSLSTIWADEVGSANAARVLKPAHGGVYQLCLSHEAVMHGLLAYCWSVMARLHLHNKEQYEGYALDHETRGIRGLQRLIASRSTAGEDPEVLSQTVLMLCCSAVYRSDLDALFLHLQGLKQMIQSMGGVGKLSWVRKEIIIYLVVRVAANTGTRSVLEASTWDPGWWWKDRFASETTLDVATGRKKSTQLRPGRSSSSAWLRTNDFPCIFMVLRELVEVDSLRKRLADGEPDEINKLFRWSFLRRQAVRARIWDYWCDLTEPTKAVDPWPGSPKPTTVHRASVGMCLCLALHLFMAFGLEASLLGQPWVSTTQIWHIMLLRCLHKLGFESDKIDLSHPGALDLLWVYGIGAVVEQMSLTHALRKQANFWILYTTDQVDIRWFSVRFGNLARRLGYRQYRDVVELFQTHFVHISSFQDPILSKIFDLGL